MILSVDGKGGCLEDVLYQEVSDFLENYSDILLRDGIELTVSWHCSAEEPFSLEVKGPIKEAQTFWEKNHFLCIKEKKNELIFSHLPFCIMRRHLSGQTPQTRYGV